MAQELRNAYGLSLAKLVKENDKIIVLDADLTKSTKTIEAKKIDPNRHINAGIAECNMMGMAAGLAASDKIVFASSFAMFASGRAYEIIRNSICYPNLNVKIAATHAGLCVGEDGASHQCIEDIALMRAIPNMQVFVPSDQYMCAKLIEYVSSIKGPCYIRMGRGKVDDIYDENTNFDFTKVNVVRKGAKVLIFACGLMVQEALKASTLLEKEGINPTIVDVCSIKPIDAKGIINLASEHDYIFTLEEHNIYGGLFSAISEVLSANLPKKIKALAVNDVFGESGKMLDVLKKYQMHYEDVYKLIKEEIGC